MAKKRFVIGIDPGVQTGVAVYDRRDKALIRCETSDFWRTYDNVFRLSDPADCVVYVEDASQIKYTFHKAATRGRNYQDQISRNVGRIQRECELLIEGLERAGYEVIRLKPSGQKWDDRQFKLITKWAGRTSEHSRDAARFCYGL